MGAYITKKLISAVVLLLIMSMVLFLLISVLPGDAALNAAMEATSEEYLENLREKMGLNYPVHIRYWNWLKDFVRGDLGSSLISGKPVVEILTKKLPCTLELTLLAMIVSLLIGIPAGAVSAVKRNSVFDIIASVMAMIGTALPAFVIGILLILLFSINWNLLPSSGFVEISNGLWSNIKSLILPAISVGAAFSATIMRQTRSAMLEMITQDFVLTAHAKGLSYYTVIIKHVLRNSLIPVITVLSMQIGRLIAGAVVTETVFVLPGIGSEIVNAILSRDYPIVMGMIMVVITGIISINLFVDIICAAIDPRIALK